ncbi:retrotransposon protein, putative, ty1-copia subclass [Tanacetum coccineum]
MEQPEGFVNPKYPNQVCKLKRSIYGLKQALRPWNKRFDDEIKKFGFTHNRDEPCVYMKVSRSYVTFLILYVDDILIMGNNIPILQDVKSYLRRCFAMKDLGEAAYILEKAGTTSEVPYQQRVPLDGKTVGSKWLFKKKIDMDEAVHTSKAYLVAKGFTQTYEVDYEETFSPVADIRAIRILIVIAAFYDYEI